MTEYNKFLDDAIVDCLSRMDQGESVESCISSYPEIRDELYSCLKLTGRISKLSVIQPSQESIDRIRTGLTARIQAQSSSRKLSPASWKKDVRDQLGGIRLRLSWARMVTAAVILAFLFTAIYSTLPSPTKVQASAKLNILSGSAQTSQVGTGVFRNAIDDLILNSGTIVRTALDSHVLITFFDESTVELDPYTEILIQDLPKSWDGSEGVFLKQFSGRTWNRLTNTTLVTYQIETPNANVLAQRGMFATEVQDDGFTQLSLIEGVTTLVGNDQEVTLAAGMQATVSLGSQLLDPEPLPLPKYQMRVNVNGSVAASVTAPSGASTGMLDDGTTFYQIPGATFERTDDGSVLTIPEPENGSYMLTLRYVAGGNPEISIEGITQGEVTCSYNGELIIDKNEGSIIQFDSYIDSEDDWEITVTGSIDKLNEHGPEKIPKVSSSDATGTDENAVYVAQHAVSKTDDDHGKSGSSSASGKKGGTEAITESDLEISAVSTSADQNDSGSSAAVAPDTSGNISASGSDEVVTADKNDKGNSSTGKSSDDDGKSGSSSVSGKKGGAEAITGSDQGTNDISAPADQIDSGSSGAVAADTSGNTAEAGNDAAVTEGKHENGNGGTNNGKGVKANDSNEEAKGNGKKHGANDKKDEK